MNITTYRLLYTILLKKYYSIVLNINIRLSYNIAINQLKMSSMQVLSTVIATVSSQLNVMEMYATIIDDGSKTSCKYSKIPNNVNNNIQKNNRKYKYTKIIKKSQRRNF